MTRFRNEPYYYVKVCPAGGGEELDVTFDVTSFSYEDSEKKTDLCKLTIENSDLRYFDHPIFEKGTILIVGWGYAEHLTPARECVVQTVKGGKQLKIEAHDKGVLMNKVARTRVFENVKRSDVARTLAEENGYGPSTQFIDDTEISIAVISQAAQTDAQFLKKLADLEGFEFFVDFDGFHWHERRFAQKPIKRYTYFLIPGVGDIQDFEVDNDVTAKPGAVVVKGHDPKTGKDVEATADDKTTARATLAAVPEVTPASPTMQRVIDPATGESRVVSVPPAANPGAKAPAASSDVRPTTAATPAAAQREANAIFRRTQQSAVQLSVTIVGDPGLVGKSVVQLDGLGRRLSGRYYVTEVTHTLEGGYVTKFKCKSDGTGGKGTGAGPATGSKAKPNTAEADQTPYGPPAATPPPPLTPRKEIDPKTGEVTYAYNDTRGRDQAPGTGG